MRKITKIIIHTTATSKDHNVTIEEITKWHLARNFNDIGYHYLIDRNAKILPGRSLDLVGAHTKGHNLESIGIALAGGANGVFNYTKAQLNSLDHLVFNLLLQFKSIKSIHGHNEFSDKACPCFDVQEWFKKKDW